jgi:predicted PurR-regulated permease PerM
MNQTGYTGLSGVFGYVAYIVPNFTSILLFSLFIIIFLGSYYSQLRTRGFGDWLGSFAVASVIIAVLSIVIYMIQPPIISGTTVLICIALAIIGVAGIFTSPER